MRRVLLLASLLIPAESLAQTSIPPLKLNGAVTAVADAYVKAVLAGDAAAIAALYDPDAVEMPPDQPLMRGKTQIEQYYRKLFGEGAKITAFRLNHMEAVASGEVAYDVGIYRQTVTPPSGKPLEESGKYTVILKHTTAGWQVIYAIYNRDQPLQAMSAPKP